MTKKSVFLRGVLHFAAFAYFNLFPTENLLFLNLFVLTLAVYNILLYFAVGRLGKKIPLFWVPLVDIFSFGVATFYTGGVYSRFIYILALPLVGMWLNISSRHPFAIIATILLAMFLLAVSSPPPTEAHFLNITPEEFTLLLWNTLFFLCVPVFGKIAVQLLHHKREEFRLLCQKLSNFLNISTTIGPETDLKDLLARATNLLVDQAGFERVLLFVRNKKHSLELIYQRGGAEESQGIQIPFNLSGGFIAQQAAADEPVLVTKEYRTYIKDKFLEKLKLNEFILLPLHALPQKEPQEILFVVDKDEPQPLGVIIATNPTGTTTEQDYQILLMLRGQINALLSNIHSYHLYRQSNQILAHYKKDGSQRRAK